MRPDDKQGRTFGRLLVTGPMSRQRLGGVSRVFWKCQCSCGEVLEVLSTALASGSVQSCGCLKVDRLTTHGLSESPEYRAWWQMKQRCYNPRNERFHRYGGRGITVCPEWIRSFEAFFADMGKRPTRDHSIDRINNDAGYAPGNCRWATRSQQQRNKGPFPKNHALPRGDDHWTRRDRSRAIEVSRENIKKAHGSGERNPNAKLSIKKSFELRRFAKENPGLRLGDVGKVFGVGRETARKVVRGLSW